MKLSKVLTTIVFLTLISCTSEKSFKLIGELKTDFEGFIYLEYEDIIDSCYIKSQKFKFEGKIEYPVYAYIYSSSLPGETFFIENKTLNISLKEHNQSLTIENYSGQTTSEIFSEFKSFADSLQSAPSFELHLFKKLKNRFAENPKSQENGMLLCFFPLSNNLSLENFLSLYNMLDLNAQNPSDIEMLNITIEKRKRFAAGEPFDNYKIPDLDDNEVFISDFQRKVLLVEFWASWCSGCLAKNIHLKELYNNYHDFGFDIIGISVDDNKSDMVNIINRENLQWDNFRVGFGDPFIRELGIQYLPSNFLIDNEGIIIATNINTNTLEEILINKLKN